MKILYTSDLHGKTDFYREIITHSKDEKIDTVILGGDLLPRRKHSLDSLKHQENFIEREIHTFVSELKNKSNISVYLILGNNDWAAPQHPFHPKILKNVITRRILQNAPLYTRWSAQREEYGAPMN